MQPRPFHLFFTNLPAEQSTWQPAVDIYRGKGEGWILKFDLAGVQPEDVAISVQGCRVQVTGIRKDWLVDEGATHYSMEISYSRFERAVDLPCELEGAAWNIEFRHGILIVRLTSR
ncbi:MAG: Hsp20/alpha crystallin family protein [Bryobacteraceae bacterium]|nr:Hsp20/alpha crystallin family protein [Bryobacteraceae bacterium]